MRNRRQQDAGGRRTARWTWLELLGLVASFFLIVSPAVGLLFATFFPPTALGGILTYGGSISASPTQIPNGGTTTITVVVNGNSSEPNGLGSVTVNWDTSLLTFVSEGCSDCSGFLNPGTNGNFSGTGANLPGGQSLHPQVVLKAIAASGTANVSANILDTNNAGDGPINTTVTISSGSLPPTPTPFPTATPLPPTNTPVPPTNTPGPGTPTNTPVPPTPTNTTGPGTPTNTPVPPTNTPGPGTPTNTPVPPTPTNTTGPGTPTNTPAGPTNTPGGPTNTPTITPGGGFTVPPMTSPVFFTPPPTSLLTPSPGTPTATPTAIVLPTNTPPGGTPATATPTPLDAITPVVLPTPALGATDTPVGSGKPGATTANNQPSIPTGVVAGVFAGTGVGGNRVDLVLRSGGSDKVVTTALIDGSGQYSFLSVPLTSNGQTYYIRYSNPNGGSSLRSWTSNQFTFGGGRLDVAATDLSDVALGAPGSNDTTYQLPLTLNWTVRNAVDSYSVTVFRSDGSGVALLSGNLGNRNSYTVAPGALPPGDYFGQVNVSNAAGSGISQRQFRFRLAAGTGGGQGGGTVPTPTSSNSGGQGGGTVPTPTRSSGGGIGVGNPTATSQGGTTTAASGSGNGSATPTLSNETVIAGTSTPSGIGVGGNTNNGGDNGGSNGANSGNNGNGNLPPGTSSLPQSGGELPLAGLFLGAITLIGRRFRLNLRRRSV